MIKQKIVIVFLAFFSLFSCQSSERIHNRLLKKAENFKATNFPGIHFDKLYIMEGTYITKGKFNVIPPKLEISRGSDTKHYEDYLVFNGNGTLEKFYAENEMKAKQLLANNLLPPFMEYCIYSDRGLLLKLYRLSKWVGDTEAINRK